MPTDLPLLLPGNPELCADGRTVLSLGGLLVGRNAVQPDDPLAVQVHATPSTPGLTPVVPMGDAVLDWRRLIAFFDRQPPEALDRMVVTLPPGLIDRLTLVALAGRADQLGLPVEAAAADLVDGAQPALARHRVLYLDALGHPATAETATSVRVLPISGRAGGAYATSPDAVLAQAANLPYPPAGLVFRDSTARIGLPAPLVRAFYADVLDGITPPGPLTGSAALEALGVTATAVAGYADLPAALGSLTAGAHALLVVDDVPYLVTRHAGTGALAVVDPATAGPAQLPLGPTAIGVAPLADDAGLAELIGLLGGQLAGAPPQSWTAATADEVQLLREWTGRDGVRRSVEALGAPGPADADLSRLIDQAIGADQSVIVLRPPGAADPLDATVLPALAKRIDRHGWDGLVPAVVNLARTDPAELFPVLDTFGVDLFLRDPTADTGGLFSLGVPWTVRHPGGTRGPASDEVTEEMLIAAGSARRAAYEPPSLPVASLLAQPLTSPAGLRQVFATHGAALRAGHAEVSAMVGRVPGYAAHEAMLNLAAQGRLDPTLDYLGTADRQHGAVLDPVLGLADADQVRDVLPHLAVLAGEGLADPVSRTIVSTIGDLMAGTTTQEAAVGAIHRLAGQLPRTDTGLRVRWTEKLSELSGQVPDQSANLAAVIRAVLTCPED